MTPTLKLVAHDTGDGWSLEIHTTDGDYVGPVEWPWRESEKTSSELREMGWEIV